MDIYIGGYPGNLFAQKVSFAAGASETEMFATQGMALVGLLMPATWTAAAITFKGCISGNIADLRTIYNNGGTAEQCVVAADTDVAFPSPDALFTPYLQLASVTVDTVTPVAQVAAHDVILLFRKFLS